jgi:GNAT superfamily N-acetyltransferase
VLRPFVVCRYPSDEAASREKLDFRIKNAGDYFLVAIRMEGDQLTVVGFVNGTCTHSPTLTHESMSTHEPGGELLCIHSVCVKESIRRTGLASRLLKAYLQYVQMDPALDSIRLLCKTHLVRVPRVIVAFLYHFCYNFIFT